MEEREWLTLEPASQRNDGFVLATYNLLADKMIEKGQYPHMEWANQKGKERYKLLWKDIINADPDIVHLQEVEEERWGNDFKCDLESHGFDGIYHKRCDELGLAVCYKRSSWKYVTHHGYVLHDLARSSIEVNDR